MSALEIVLSILLLIALTVIAIRFDFKFDLNKWLESKKEARQIKLKNLCPHVVIYEGKDGSPYIESLFYKHPTKLFWYCRRCDAFSPNQLNEVDLGYWVKNLKELANQEKAFHKEAKKMGLTP